METLTPALKAELIEAIKKIELNYLDFDHNLEDYHFTYANCKKYEESENLSITIEFQETLRWRGYEDCEFHDLTIEDLEVIAENGIVDISELNEKELLNLINY